MKNLLFLQIFLPVIALAQDFEGNYMVKGGSPNLNRLSPPACIGKTKIKTIGYTLNYDDKQGHWNHKILIKKTK